MKGRSLLQQLSTPLPITHETTFNNIQQECLPGRSVRGESLFLGIASLMGLRVPEQGQARRSGACSGVYPISRAHTLAYPYKGSAGGTLLGLSCYTATLRDVNRPCQVSLPQNVFLPLPIPKFLRLPISYYAYVSPQPLLLNQNPSLPLELPYVFAHLPIACCHPLLLKQNRISTVLLHPTLAPTL